MAFYLALKNIFSRKSSIAIILFISFSISLMVLSNALFDGTGQGIEKTFVQSFTGDVVIRPKVNFPLSLLGDETPATGAFSEIPQIIPYTQIQETVSSQPQIQTVIPQLSSQAVINTGGTRTICVAFGVDAENYVPAMSGISIVEGTPYKNDEKGILLSQSMLDSIEKACGVRYKVGDSVQLLAGNGISYSLRSAILTGIYEYEIRNEVLDRICLISPAILRELTGIAQTTEENIFINQDQNDLIESVDDSWDVDDLFGEWSDTEIVITDTSVTSSASATDTLVTSSSSATDTEEPLVTEALEVTHVDTAPLVTSWNYLVCKTAEKNPKSVAARLNRIFRKNGWEVEAITWRSAAGLSAMYLYWIHNILVLGVIVLLGVGFIIVNNTLTVSALDRIPETGTLRAIGGTKKFIILQFMCETSMLTIISGILGFVLGVILNYFLNRLNITFTNSYLIQLFGGTTLKTLITFSNFLKCMGLSVVLGIIGWIYPVKISMEVNPVQAMQRGI